jgi:hypothetical protein
MGHLFKINHTPDGTQVTVSPIYKLKFGLLGQFLDRFYGHRNYLEGLQSLLQA